MKLGHRTNMVSIFPENPRFYRNENKDIFMRCACGHDEIVQKSVEKIDTEISKRMMEMAANHNCEQVMKKAA